MYVHLQTSLPETDGLILRCRVPVRVCLCERLGIVLFTVPYLLPNVCTRPLGYINFLRFLLCNPSRTGQEEKGARWSAGPLNN